MFVYKKCFATLAFMAALFLYGCEAENISLENALRESIKNEASESVLEETKMPGQEEETELVYVYVCGAVYKPGVYGLQEGSRIVAAIEAAGGFLPDAAKEAVNLAKVVTDGSQITVPDSTEAAFMLQQESLEQFRPVNLNTATEKELCTLSGIGAAKAQAILAYRREIGGFRDINQLMDVSGIGESLFNRIKDNIYIE